MTRSGHVGILATSGTVESKSYVIEIRKYFPEITVVQEACPMWVPIVENNECDSEGADYFVRQHVTRLLAADRDIDTIILGCTHYPLLQKNIRRYLSDGILLVSQGKIVARRLADYLERHADLADCCSKQGRRDFYSSEKPEVFDRSAAFFYGREVQCREKA
jgi:glutamate racemase